MSSKSKANSLIDRGIRKAGRILGYDVQRIVEKPPFPPDIDAQIIEVFQRVQPFTMTSLERVFSLCKSVEYVVEHDIPGDIVECGVWKGGSMMAVAKTLQRLGHTRKLHLFDTFDGMSDPTENDQDYHGAAAADRLDTEDKDGSWVWAYSPLEDVKKNFADIGYDMSQVSFVQGKVEDTIPENAPPSISLLRLDTDWFESTYHELKHLYPLLSVGGVLIIDDYGHWQGARKAVDQYIDENNLKVLLSRIDYTARVCVKVEE